MCDVDKPARERKKRGNEMRVMTFNIRFENERDGTNAWVNRRELVARTIERHSPDIVGTQEGKWHQLLYIRARLPGYVFCAPGRVVDETSQYPTLFYREDGFEVEEAGEFWLSKTPDVHRSKSWDSGFPRMMSYLKLTERESGHSFWAAVTHLDNIGSEARFEQASILSRWVKEREGPVMLMGDFNDDPQSRIHELLAGPETMLRDTWRSLGRGESGDTGTHHGFTGVPQDQRIDWILVSRNFRVFGARVVRDDFDGRYPSDHFPYMADLDWMDE
jgi:endonuclease/exonuclease/phosphatase family metal-dependent hydrolase